MTNLGRFSVSASLLAALLALPCVASAYEAPEAYCHEMAERAYDRAKALGDGLPDATYNRVQANCEYTAYRAHLVADRAVSLNELIAFDHDGDSWLLTGPESDSDRELDRQDSEAFLLACPTAQPGDVTCAIEER